jgi:hypothetical protein
MSSKMVTRDKSHDIEYMLFIFLFAFLTQAQDSLPNPILTPGDTLSVNLSTLCTPGYSKQVRNVHQSTKDSVYNFYKITSHKTGDYEVDHLIPLCLGGSNSIKNLWPESYLSPWNAHKKNRLEVRLHKLVCTKHITLQEAQQAFASNWIDAYKKYIGNKTK